MHILQLSSSQAKSYASHLFSLANGKHSASTPPFEQLSPVVFPSPRGFQDLLDFYQNLRSTQQQQSYVSLFTDDLVEVPASLPPFSTSTSTQKKPTLTASTDFLDEIVSLNLSLPLFQDEVIPMDYPSFSSSPLVSLPNDSNDGSPSLLDLDLSFPEPQRLFSLADVLLFITDSRSFSIPYFSFLHFLLSLLIPLNQLFLLTNSFDRVHLGKLYWNNFKIVHLKVPNLSLLLAGFSGLNFETYFLKPIQTCRKRRSTDYPLKSKIRQVDDIVEHSFDLVTVSSRQVISPVNESRPPETPGFVTGKGKLVSPVNESRPPETPGFVTGKGKLVSPVNESRPPETPGFVTGKGKLVSPVNESRPPETPGFVTGKGKLVSPVNESRPPETPGFVTGKGKLVSPVNESRPPETPGFVTGKGKLVSPVNESRPPETPGFVTGKGKLVSPVNESRPPETPGFVTGKAKLVSPVNESRPPETPGFVTGKGKLVSPVNESRPPETPGFVTGKGKLVSPVNESRLPETPGFVTGKGKLVSPVNESRLPETPGFVTGKGKLVSPVNESRPPETPGFVTGKGKLVSPVNESRPPETPGFVTGKGKLVSPVNESRPPETPGFVTGIGKLVSPVNESRPPETPGFVTGKGKLVSPVNESRPPETPGFVTGKGKLVSPVNESRPPETPGFVTGKGKLVSPVNESRPPETPGFVTGKGKLVSPVNESRPPETPGFVTGKGKLVSPVNESRPPETPGFVTCGETFDNYSQNHSYDDDWPDLESIVPNRDSHPLNETFLSSPSLKRTSPKYFEPPLKIFKTFHEFNDVTFTSHLSLLDFSRLQSPVALSSFHFHRLNVFSHYFNDTVEAEHTLAPQFGSTAFWLTTLAKQFPTLSESFVIHHYLLLTWKCLLMHGLFPAGRPTSLLEFNQTIVGIKDSIPWLSSDFMFYKLFHRCRQYFNLGKRSVLWKIIDRDFPCSMTMVLQVFSIDTSLESIYLTDGYAVVSAVLDAPLRAKLLSGRLNIGRKLLIANAKLESAEDEDATPVLNTSLQVKLSFNSTAPVKWWTRLGLSKTVSFFALGKLNISRVTVDGGVVPVLRVRIQRVLPLLYVEINKTEDDNKIVFRSLKGEENRQRRISTRAVHLYEQFQEEAFSELNEYMPSQVARSEQGDETAAAFIVNEMNRIIGEKFSENKELNAVVTPLQRFLVSDSSTVDPSQWSLLTVWGASQEQIFKESDCLCITDLLPSQCHNSSLLSNILFKTTKTSAFLPLKTLSCPFVSHTVVTSNDQLFLLPNNTYFDAIAVLLLKGEVSEHPNVSHRVVVPLMFTLLCEPPFENFLCLNISMEISHDLYVQDGELSLPTLSDVILIKNLVKRINHCSTTNTWHFICSDVNDFVVERSIPRGILNDLAPLRCRFFDGFGPIKILKQLHLG
ncbi:hypothetical protein RCL1_001813 [Eukaryota sp. TZLM3-RCL]